MSTTVTINDQVVDRVAKAILHLHGQSALWRQDPEDFRREIRRALEAEAARETALAAQRQALHQADIALRTAAVTYERADEPDASVALRRTALTYALALLKDGGVWEPTDEQTVEILHESAAKGAR